MNENKCENCIYYSDYFGLCRSPKSEKGGQQMLQDDVCSEWEGERKMWKPTWSGINIPDPSEQSFSGAIYDTGASPYEPDYEEEDE